MADSSQASGRRLHLAYAETSRDLVAPFAKALEAAGFRVDWQNSNSSEAADAIVVCWTPAAVASDAVGLEAARARKARKLTPVLLAPCSPPAELGGRRGIADLSTWRGDPSDPDFVALVHSIHARLSGRIMSSQFWRSRWFSWGGAGAVSLAVLTLAINAGGLKQAYDGLFNPGASEAALTATDAKVDEVLELLKGKNGKPLDPESEASLRESIAKLLSAQSGARGKAADKLAKGDLGGAISDLKAMADEGEKAAASLAETWTEIGALYYADDTFESLAAYERAVQLNPKDNSARLQLGNLDVRAGRLDEARKVYLDIYEGADSDDAKTQALALGSLGMVAVAQGDLKQADDYLAQALELDQQLKNVEGQAFDLGDLGDVAQARGDLKKAGDLFQRSLGLMVQVKNIGGQSNTYARIGGLAMARKDLNAAEANYRKSLELAEDADEDESRAEALISLGDVAFQRGQTDKAREQYNEALKLAQTIGLSAREAGADEGLADLAEKAGDKTKAIEYVRSARDIYRGMNAPDDVERLNTRLKKLGATPSPEGAEN
jgi:tetratricopeptide (TPR) repeat protein